MGLSSTALTMEKIAVLAPMPSARAPTAARVNPGLLRNARMACLASATTSAKDMFVRVSGTGIGTFDGNRCQRVLELAKAECIVHLLEAADMVNFHRLNPNAMLVLLGTAIYVVAGGPLIVVGGVAIALALGALHRPRAAGSEGDGPMSLLGRRRRCAPREG